MQSRRRRKKAGGGRCGFEIEATLSSPVFGQTKPIEDALGAWREKTVRGNRDVAANDRGHTFYCIDDYSGSIKQGPKPQRRLMLFISPSSTTHGVTSPVLRSHRHRVRCGMVRQRSARAPTILAQAVAMILRPRSRSTRCEQVQTETEHQNTPRSDKRPPTGIDHCEALTRRGNWRNVRRRPFSRHGIVTEGEDPQGASEAAAGGA